MKKLYKISRTPTKELIVRCDCGEDNFFSLLSFAKAWDDDDEEVDQLYVCCGANKMWRWRDKVRVAWRILRDGEYRNFGTLMGRPDVKKTIKYLQSILDLWDKLEKQQKEMKKKIKKETKKCHPKEMEAKPWDCCAVCLKCGAVLSGFVQEQLDELAIKNPKKFEELKKTILGEK